MCNACDNVVRYCEQDGPQCSAPSYAKTSAFVTDEIQEARLVDEFRFAIDDLWGALDSLRFRLRPVSTTEYADPSGAPSELLDVSAARTELYRLHTLAGALRGVVDRLEV